MTYRVADGIAYCTTHHGVIIEGHGPDDECDMIEAERDRECVLTNLYWMAQ